MVVSIANVSPAHASRYYTEGKAGNSQLPPSEWYGSGSRALGMAQTVEPSNLHFLLRGELPDGTVLVDKTRCRQQQANAKATGKPVPTERAGLDLTASAPKSVSLQALVFGDRLLELAHQQANREMLRVLEERYAFTRITQDGKRMKVATGEVAIACFHHDTSRALDPQIHTHNVILNFQRHPKTGRWQSLDNTEIYKAKMLLGQIYRNELACAVQDLGYSIHITNQRHGLWELEGFTSKQLQAFSTRMKQIEEAVGVGASSKAQAWANRITRPSKVEYDQGELRHYWQYQAQSAGLIYPQPQPLPIQAATSDSMAIAQITQWLSEWIGQLHAQAIERKELEQKLLQQPGQLPFSALEQIINAYLPQNSIPLIGTNPDVFQRVHGVFTQTSGSTNSGSTNQHLPGDSDPQPRDRSASQEISQTASTSTAFGEFTPTERPFLAYTASPSETDATWADDTSRSEPERTGNPDRSVSASPVTADASEGRYRAAGRESHCRPETSTPEHGGISTDVGGNREASRLGQEFRALGELVAQVLERHERRTMVRTEDETRPDDPCLDRSGCDSSQKATDPNPVFLVNPVETDTSELERER
jgi:conjugative relaxase-like TrwC/TraI family protein